MTLADKLKEARKNAGLTQAELAEKICVSRQAITKWETDKGIPDIDNLRVLSKVLNVSIDFLLDEEETFDQTVIKEEICLDDSVQEEELESNDMLPILKIVFIVLLVLCTVLLSVFLLLWTARRTCPAGLDSQVGQELESKQPVEEPATPDKIESTEPPVAETPEPLDTPEPEVQGTEEPETTEEPEATEEPSYAGMVFTEVNEPVTAKDATNLRNVPSQGEDSQVLMTLQNGQVAMRIGVSEAGWSKLEYNGETYYAVSSLLTTDLTVKPEPEDDGIKTVFTECNEKVCPKIEVNLRTLPSVTNPDSQVVVTIRHGDIVTRTGINTDVGWSRVQYGDQILYCISSYVYVVEE